MRQVAWTEAAIADLEAIRTYLAAVDEGVAERSTSALIRSARWLLDHPGAGPALGYRRWRKWKPRGERHLLIYEPTARGIVIVRVRHERNDWRDEP